jgi:hypothetical protein
MPYCHRVCLLVLWKMTNQFPDSYRPPPEYETKYYQLYSISKIKNNVKVFCCPILRNMWQSTAYFSGFQALTACPSDDSRKKLSTNTSKMALKAKRWSSPLNMPWRSRPALGPNRSPIQWVTGLFLGGKAAGAWIFMACYRVNFTFTFPGYSLYRR